MGVSVETSEIWQLVTMLGRASLSTTNAIGHLLSNLLDLNSINWSPITYGFNKTTWGHGRYRWMWSKLTTKVVRFDPVGLFLVWFFQVAVVNKPQTTVILKALHHGKFNISHIGAPSRERCYIPHIANIKFQTYLTNTLFVNLNLMKDSI